MPGVLGRLAHVVSFGTRHPDPGTLVREPAEDAPGRGILRWSRQVGNDRCGGCAEPVDAGDMLHRFRCAEGRGLLVQADGRSEQKAAG